MKKIVALVSLVFLFTACVGTSKTVMKGVAESDKTAALHYTDIGLTSAFEFKGIATGTYKSLGYEAGLVYHAGAQNIELTVDAAQSWAVKAESKRQGFKVSGIDLRLHNPYVAAVTRGKKTIGTIAIDMPTVDKTQEVIKYVGLDNVIRRNLHLTGKADILGKDYDIESVYHDQSGKKAGSPLGYQVVRNKKPLGIVQVGKNLTGGQVLTLFIKPGLAPVVEQSVVATLLVCGYAI